MKNEEKTKQAEITEQTESPMPQSNNNEHSGEISETQTPKPQLVYVTETFMSLVYDAVGSLPYSTKLTSNIGQTITLNKFVSFLEQHTETGMTIEEMNLIINFMYSLPFRNVRKLMNIAETPDEQSKLWTIKNPE